MALANESEVVQALERAEAMAHKPSAFAQTYEEGVRDALGWVLGHFDDPTEE